MSAVICPAGHASTDPEWCDTCGARIGASPDAAAGGAAGAGAGVADPPAASAGGDPAPPTAAQPCPHCNVLNSADNLYCEACGYDFTTGQKPPDAPAPAAAPSTEPVTGPAWVVVVEVSPEWFALKGALADQPCPPASTSTVAITGHTALVGRSSQSRGVRPEIALDRDTGVSRRHAQFVRDGEHLTVVDLSSTNGTYVVYDGEDASEDTPAAQPGVSTAIDDGDAVYLGAWTKLTVRRS